jgi:hypothetical protein
MYAIDHLGKEYPMSPNGFPIITASQTQYCWRLSGRLKQREQEHGFAYVTPNEAAFLKRYGLYQPGHTVFRYSVPGENLSDAAQDAES